MAPDGLTPAVSCTCTQVVSPLLSGFFAKPTDTGVGGAVLTVKLLTGDHAVRAGSVGEELPCAERTRQNLVPGVSDVSVAVGAVNWLYMNSMVPKPESVATSSVYPEGCGLGTSVQLITTGSVSVAPVAGEIGDGAGPIGLLKNTEKPMTFEG